jgi:hypothetical protein
VDVSGDVLSVSGEITAVSYDELAAKIAQLRGMVDNPDEPVFPVEFADLPDLSGFYRGFSVSVTASQPAMSVFRAGYSLSATRVPDFAQPTIEIQVLSVRRTNAHGLAPATGYLFRRLDRPGWRMPDAASSTVARRTSDGYDLYAIEAPNATARTVSYQSDTSSHYGATATIEQAVGAGWLPVVGRQLPDLDPGEVRLTNGFQRVTVTNNGQILHQVFDPVSGVFDQVSFRVQTAANNLDLWLDPTIIHNDPDLVSIRYTARPASDATYATVGGASVTISMGAGEGFAQVSVETLRPAAVSAVKLVAFPFSQPGTSLTGGVRRTSNDAAGNRLVIATPHAKTDDTANTGVTVNTATTSRPVFMIGQALNGSSAAAINSEASLIAQFIQSVSASSRVVAR